MELKHNHLLIALFYFVIISCSSPNIVYFSDLPKGYAFEDSILNYAEHKIQPLDLLGITVSTLNPESNLLFNSGIISYMGSGTGNVNNATQLNEGYRVDKTGFINFPILGKIKVADLTIEEATDKMINLLELEAKNPIVNIKLLNFRITVIGEVNLPNTFPILTERINILEAIGLAGDLTAFGKRENVLIIREKEGVRTIARMDLNKKTSFSSPYFYLQQNDIVYVEPTKARADQASLARSNISLALSIITLLVLIFL